MKGEKMEKQNNSTNSNTENQVKPANNDTVSGNIPAEKTIYTDVSIKGLIATKEVQEAIRHCVYLPDIFTVKKLKNPFENKETKDKTQKIEVMSGTTIEDAVSFELVLFNTELDPVKAVNKKYRIIDYTFALEANMSGGKFSGYAATGLKLVVTKLEEVK